MIEGLQQERLAPRMQRVLRLPRRTMHPGRFLLTRFLRPARVSQDALARDLGISRRRLNEIVNGRRAISADTALRLALYFGTETEFWLRLQAAWDIHQAWRSYAGAESR
ncbi:addiction module antidote protein, HigA family [Sinimarinibacterium sp. CAU 1509]|nr:addiction module antidote protein, HigA family [Sinimarinibacterium sp. CAU 1509]